MCASAGIALFLFLLLSVLFSFVIAGAWGREVALFLFLVLSVLFSFAIAGAWAGCCAVMCAGGVGGTKDRITNL